MAKTKKQADPEETPPETEEQTPEEADAPVDDSLPTGHRRDRPAE